VFGGFAPFIAVGLTDALGSPLAPTAYVIAAATISLLVIRRMPETARRPLA
jgi:MHS family proline/betaine transporter-like MFS transporter